MDIPIRSVLVAVAVLCVAAAAPKANAVNPPPDGGYPGGNTAEGLGALFSLTTGSYNTAVGYFSLRTNTAGDFNTALGAATLFANTANQNTALGAGALLSNATGAFNTANGAFALFSNTDGPSNTAVGNMALFNNTSGDGNTAVGESAMIANTMGASNTAAGVSALRNNLTGNFNTAIGHGALVANQASANTAVGFRAAYGNTTGYSNTAIGNGALIANETGWENIAIGDGALASNAASTTSTAVGVRALGGGTQGVLNTAIGYEAGYNVDGIGNVCIGPGVHGEAGTLGNTWIANVYSSAAGDRAVYVNSDNKLGTLVSSRRYKDNIKLMAEASEAIFSLHPVSFRYKKEIDPARCLSFGLIAEDVVQVDPNLVTADRNGNPETVRYEAVNAMLLNEFLKEHRKVQKLETALEALNARLKEQEMELQRVSARVEMRKAARRVASRK
jgi:endosialidase-like protein